MFCNKCGTQMDDLSQFCSVCGARRPEAAPPSPPPEQSAQPYGAQQLYNNTPQQPYAQQPYAPQQPYAQQSYGYGAPQESVPPVPGKKKLWKVFVPVCAALVLVVCVAFYFLIIATPQAAVGTALSGLKDEMANRLNGTPFKAVAMLPDAFENGQITVGFDYTDYWGDKVSGNVGMQMDAESRSYAILADIFAGGLNVDLKAYINNERIALNSSLLDSNYYGFGYDTFREDIVSFGNVIGLDGYTRDTLADAVEMIGESMNVEVESGEVNEEYANVLTEFFKSLESDTSKAVLPFGNSSTKYQKVDYIITKDALVGLLDSYYNVMKNDTVLREQLDNYYDTLSQYGLDAYTYSDAYPFGTDYDDFLDSFADVIDTFEREYNGNTELSFYIDDDRLVAVTVKSDITVDGETGVLEAVCDFGLNPTDAWVIAITLTDPDGNVETATITWEYSDDNDDCVNKITIKSGEGMYADEITLSSTWSRSSGAFTLAYNDGYDAGEVTGSFKETSKGFELKLDNLADEYYGEELLLTITVEKGVKIDAPSYISLADWDENLIYLLEDMIYRLS